jgi:hypothetical protein
MDMARDAFLSQSLQLLTMQTVQAQQSQGILRKQHHNKSLP